MSLRLYNSYTRRKENFHPLKDKVVRMYNCGPTVYDYVHIGNLRSFLFADILRRYLEYRDYRVRQVMNITDVGHMTTEADAGEDKLSLAMRREKKGPQEVARFYEGEFFKDLDALEVKRAWKYPRATGHVAEMIGLIKKLLKRGYAYLVCEGAPPLTLPQRGGEEVQFPTWPEGGRGRAGVKCSVYYDLSTFPKYGELSGNTVEDLIPGARAEVVHEKRNPYDFALWIFKPEHFLQWSSPWGRGYPGWHLECSAMAMKYLGATLDIHTGGEDNKFPHHECEIAQSEGATGKQFSRLWLHVKHLLVDGKKMSKSLGNFYTLRDLMAKGYLPREARYALISAHYRETLNFTEQSLEAARSALQRIDEMMEKLSRNTYHVARNKKSLALSRATKLSFDLKRTQRNFTKAMDDDLNVPKALGILFEFIRKINVQMSDVRCPMSADKRRQVIKFLREVDSVFGLMIDFEKKKEHVPAEIVALVEQREVARNQKDWKKADQLRAKIVQSGYQVEDTANGPRIRKIA